MEKINEVDWLCLVAGWTFLSSCPCWKMSPAFTAVPFCFPLFDSRRTSIGGETFIEWQTRTFEMWLSDWFSNSALTCGPPGPGWGAKPTAYGWVRIWPPASSCHPSSNFTWCTYWGRGSELPLTIRKCEARVRRFTSKATQLFVVKPDFWQPSWHWFSICWRLTTKPSVPGLSGACHRVWFVVSPWFCSFLGNLPFHSLSRPIFGELLECARHSASHWVDNVKQNRLQIRGMEKALESLEVWVSLLMSESNARRPVSL